ncbi:ubiquitin carboxyl-terminal hydrolase 27 isoform X2 [Daucus carota subsp. sativus]|uniref:ubiquitin carboxyl-terminal hydrolase 27 isoform X2 n=1 Tax=Daucus carota subsp. sativus TaxID=79200 RepID=UPI0007F01F02|nr:PREDICTED: ubiquitin carboxyl-terminal hydrolase 27 isoform X2 [Daucus carota subsp. sativus]
MKIKGQVDTRLVINNLRHGLHNLPASGMRISLVALLGAAGAVLILKDAIARNFKIVPCSTSQDNLLVVPGLQNLGNNCFLNVILQALASCSGFRGFVRKRVAEHQGFSAEELEEIMPLAVSLDSLLEDMCTPQHEIKVLSPLKVMMAINYYNQHFNLTNQQDAEEAFLHILSSLREELVELYVYDYGSLADAVCLVDNRILGLESRATQIELQRWKEYSLGPFDGILRSILTCHSCSNQISLDFHYFHSLHLPVMAGSSVEGCLKHFFAAEKLDDYFCSRCWHIAAVKYLSITNKYKKDTVEVGNCSNQDSCDCRNLSMLRALPWSNSYSRTLKQLNVARSPEILCLHLQRVSPNMFGELFKFQGHISFPLTLNMSRFMNSGGGLKSCMEEDKPVWPSKPYCQPAFTFFEKHDMQIDTIKINHTVGQTEMTSLIPEQIQAPCGVPKNTCTGGEEGLSDQLDDKGIQDSQGRPNLSSIGGYSGIGADNALLQSNKKIWIQIQIFIYRRIHFRNIRLEAPLLHDDGGVYTL